MALTESEELELLQLERDRGADASSPGLTVDGVMNAAKKTANVAAEYATKTQPISSSIPGVATQITKFASPFPSSPTSNPVSELEGKRQFLQGAAQKVKGEAESVIGNTVSKASELAQKYLPAPLAKAVQTASGLVGGGAATASAILPFSPAEFATQSAGAVIPAAISQGGAPVAEGIANQFANTPKGIRESRLEQGQPTVGKDMLKVSDKFNAMLPKQSLSEKVAGEPNQEIDLATNNKDSIFKQTKLATDYLGRKIKERIVDVFKFGRHAGSRGMGPFAEPDDFPSIDTSEVSAAIDPVLDRVARGEGVDSASYRALQSLKSRWQNKPSRLNFMAANDERVLLGEDIGKGFQRDAGSLPDLVEAQRNMWAVLRNKLGQIDPELDEMLQLDHSLIDIKNTVKPEASKGYTKTPDTVIGTLKYPGRSIGVANFIENTLPDKGARYGQAGTLGLSKAIEEKMKSAKR